MLLGCIADDFTGASDIANTLARAGMRTRLFIGTPVGDAEVDAGVVALKTRSGPAAAAVAQSLSALNALRAQGCAQVVFKYCSTFDSTPEGNIGPVADALADALGVAGVVVCPAFPANGRTVYQGYLFVHDRLLSESGMERHPLTPMTDPDLRRWLARQSRQTPGHIGLATVRQGADAIEQELEHARSVGTRLVVVDAVSDEDLMAIGRAAADAPLLTGGSGVAMGLPDNFRRRGALKPRASAFRPQPGPALVLAGSCSRATRDQVDLYARSHPVLRISVDSLLEGEPLAEEAWAFLQRYRDAAPLLCSSDTPEAVAAAQARYGTERAATAIEGLMGTIAVQAASNGFGRIVVAGGETSGAVVTALSLHSLDLGPEIDPGVPALSASDRPLALALKSGNFGAVNFLEKAVAMLGGV